MIDTLDDLLYNAKPIPLTEQVRVDRNEIFEILDQMRTTLPEELKQARWIVKEQREARPAETRDPRLGQIAASLEELKRSQRASPPPLTAAAAEQVRTIVEAAETSAAKVEHEAEEEARRIAATVARREGESRRRTAAEMSERLERAEKAADGVAGEAGEVSAELARLLDGLRTTAEALKQVIDGGASSLQSDFEGLRRRLAEVDAPEAEPPAVERRSPREEGPPTSEFEAVPPAETGYVSAERLSGAPTLNQVAHRHLQQDEI